MGVGVREHVPQGGEILVPLRPVADILGVDLPALPGVGEPLAEAVVLLLLGDVEEELHDHGAARGEHGFELVDLVIGAAPFRLAAEALDPLDEDPAVPAPVEDRDFARGGQPVPEAPEVMMRLLLGRRRGDRPNLVAARIHLGGDALDRPALPGRVPALADNDRSLAVEVIGDGEVREPLLQGGQILVVIARIIGAGFVIVESDGHETSCRSSRQQDAG